MWHRRTPSLAALLVTAVAAAACPSNPTPSSCVIEQHRFPGSPLTLLPDARLDRIGDTFVLLGTDGNDVLWAALNADGTMGPEHVYQLTQPHLGPPLFAVAGASAAMDRLVVAYVPADAATVGSVNLMTVVVGFDNTMPTLPVSSGGVAAGAHMVAISGRGGRHAGIAWAVPGRTDVMVRVLTGDGQPAVPDINLGNVGDFSCLRFLPGREDLTIGYVDLTGMPTPMPAFVGAEINLAGQIGVSGMGMPSFRLELGSQTPGCFDLAPTTSGCGPNAVAPCYGVAWHGAGIGTFFGVLDPVNKSFPSNPVLHDVRVQGTPPDVGGLGWTGKDYALVFTHTNGAEIWPIDAMGQRQGALPVLPSAAGHTGTVSTQPVGTALYLTYADYSSADPANTSDGQRFLVRVTCP